MTKRKQILLIEDDLAFHPIIKSLCQKDFELHTAKNLDAANEIIAQTPNIDIALVDQHLGEDRGSDWIKQVKKNAESPRSYLLYSGNESEESLLASLECGAQDYIQKPFALNTLKQKLDRLCEYHDELDKYQNDIDYREQIIEVAMTQASKFGECMQLTKQLNDCACFDSLQTSVTTFLNKMGLRGIISLTDAEGNQYVSHSHRNQCSPIELNVVELLKNKGRIYSFGDRMMFNHPLASLLIVNLSPDDEETTVWQDALASLIESIGSRAEFLIYKDSMESMHHQIKSTVSNLNRMIEESKAHRQEAIEEITTQMGLSFHVLNMSDEQEEYLTNIIHNALEKQTQDDMHFVDISSTLDETLVSIDHLQSLNKASITTEPDPQPEDDDILF